MKVFNLGLSRTATTSFHYAMEHLGFRSLHALHGGSDYFNPYLNRLIKGNFDWAVFKNYDAFSDLPFPVLYRQLHRKFPNAKFVYTTRLVDEWLDSCEYWFTTMGSFFKTGFDEYGYVKIDAPSFVRTIVYGIPHFDREIFREFYLTHRRNMLKYFLDNGLELCTIDLKSPDDVKWKTLCEHLGVKKVPKIPFPRKNFREQ